MYQTLDGEQVASPAHLVRATPRGFAKGSPQKYWRNRSSGSGAHLDNTRMPPGVRANPDIASRRACIAGD